MPKYPIHCESLSLYYKDQGVGSDTVVLLHGFPFDSDLWLPQMRSLASQYRVVAPDLRGFGASDPSPKPYSVAQLADDVAVLLGELDVERAVIGGLSLGGYVAFEFYRRHRELARALILADTKPDPDSLDVRASRAAMAELVRNEGSEAVVEELLIPTAEKSSEEKKAAP